MVRKVKVEKESNVENNSADLIDKKIKGLKIALKVAIEEEKELIKKRIKAFEIAKKMSIPKVSVAGDFGYYNDYSQEEKDAIKKKYGFESPRFSATTLPKTFDWKNADVIGIQTPTELEDYGDEWLDKKGIDKKKFGLALHSNYGKNSKMLDNLVGLDDEGYYRVMYLYEKGTDNLPKSFDWKNAEVINMTNRYDLEEQGINTKKYWVTKNPKGYINQTMLDNVMGIDEDGNYFVLYLYEKGTKQNPLQFADGLKKNQLLLFKDKYFENEDNNLHSENVLLLAQNFGTLNDINNAVEIVKQHEKDGQITTENRKKRMELDKSLMPKAIKTMSENNIMFFQNTSFAKGGYTRPSNKINTTGFFWFETKDDYYIIRSSFFERQNDIEDSLEIQDILREKLGSIIILNSAWKRLSDGKTIKARSNKGNLTGTLKRFANLYENYNLNKMAKGGILENAQTCFTINNDYYGNLELGFYDVEFKNEKGTSRSSKSFFKLNDAFDKLFEYIKSENGQYIIEKNPKSNFYIEERSYDGKSTDYDGSPEIKDKTIFKISSKKINNLMNSNNFKDGGMVSKSKYYIILKKGLTITNESYSDELYFDTFKTGIQYSNWVITAEQYEKLKNNDTITIKGSNVSWSWKFKVTRDMVESIREIKTNNVEFDNGGEVGDFAKGGSVEYVDTNNKITYHFLRFPNAIGSFAWINGKYIEGILYNLDEFDKDYYSHLRLKNGEKLFRYSTDRMIAGSKYLIKINLDKGLIYFMSEQNDINDDKNISFETRGIKSEYIILDKDKFADGGVVDYYELQTLKNEESILERRLLELIDNQYDGWRIDSAKIKSDLEMVREKINELENSYENGGSVDNLLEQNIINKIQYYPKGIPPMNHKYGVRYKGKTYTSNDTDDLVQKVLLETKEYKNGGGVGKMELRKVYDGRYENSNKEEVLVIDAGIKDSEFTRFTIYDEILDFNVGNTKTKQEAISKLENYVKNNYNVVNKFDNGGDNNDLTKQEILSKYKGKYLDLLIGEDGKHQVIDVSNTKKPRYFLAEEWYNDLYAKGGNVSSIEKKVQEVNRLIDLANKNDISVIDSSSTWESPMKYKPIKYSNGTLYIEYQELDLYKNNRTGINEYVTKKDKVLKRNMEFDNPLNDIAKWYRKALKQADIMYEDGGSVDDGDFAMGGGVIWDKDSDSIRTELGEFKVRITPQMQKGYYDVFVSANKKEIGKKYDVYGIDNAKDISLEIISNSNKFAKGGKVKRDTLNVLNELYDLKDDGVTEVQLNGFYESIGYVIGLELNDTEIKKVGNNAYITLYENGGSVDSADSNNLVNIDIYKLAEEMSEKDFRNKFLTLSKSEKENAESLIRLGDDKKIALITILGKREETNNDDVYKMAYHYAKGGNIDSKGRTIPQSILDFRKNYADGDENTRIRTWYMKTYPQDNRGEYIDLYNTFEDLWIAIQNNEDVYNTIVEADSLIRERLFSKLSDIKGVTYKYIYDKWLGIEDLLEESDNEQYKTGGSVGMNKSYNNPENATHVLHIDNQNWYLEKIDSTHFYMSNDPNFRGMAHHIGQHNGEIYYDEVKQWLKDTQYAKGGSIKEFNLREIKSLSTGNQKFLTDDITDKSYIYENGILYDIDYNDEAPHYKKGSAHRMSKIKVNIDDTFVKGDGLESLKVGDLILIKCDTSLSSELTFVVSKSELNKIPYSSELSLEEKAKEFVYQKSEQSDNPFYVQYYFKRIVTNKVLVHKYLKGYNHTEYKIIPSSTKDGSFYIETGTYHKFANGGSVEKITQAEWLNQNFKKAKESIIEIHKRVKLKSGNELLLLKKESGWGITIYNPKSKKELQWEQFAYKEDAIYWFNIFVVHKEGGAEGVLDEDFSPYKFNDGGSVDGLYIDLFEDYENIPAEVQMILDEYSESFEDGDYIGMSKAQDELKQIGYIFNFYVDGDAYGLRPIDVKLSQLKGYEDADEE